MTQLKVRFSASIRPQSDNVADKFWRKQQKGLNPLNLNLMQHSKSKQVCFVAEKGAWPFSFWTAKLQIVKTALLVSNIV